MSITPALLAFADGTLFWGQALGLRGEVTGEVVFNTAMMGYQEILTDPSYAGQMVTFTHPHIGNVGINTADKESKQAWAAGLIVREASPVTSNWRAEQSFSEWLQAQALVGISGVDTRRLTLYLREQGAQMACLSSLQPEPAIAIAKARAATPMLGRDLTHTVSTNKPYVWTESLSSLLTQALPFATHNYHVVVYDFGVKYSILRQLAARGCKVTVVPAATSATEVLSYQPQAVILSNGPGDPEACESIITEIKTLLSRDIPILGICLGHQLLALAVGAKTFKMKFGHHGANHPVKDLRTNRVQVTSQNHNFAVIEASLPSDWQVTHRSLFDGTIQGLKHSSKPVMSVQGHPEAGPGPLDATTIFDEFLALLS